MSKKPSIFPSQNYFVVLSPYFWPERGSDGTWKNRLRTTSAWLLVALSKLATLSGPVYLSKATNEILVGNSSSAINNIAIYCILRFFAQFFFEIQNIIVTQVKRQASIQLQELVFSHLHGLSLTWHLSKKSGSVLKKMERGIHGVNELGSQIYLFLAPSLIESLVVIVVFFTQYRHSLGIFLFMGIVCYAQATFILTQSRKNARKASNASNNEYLEKAADSFTNFETVKYFTNERYEVQNYMSSVIKYEKNVTMTNNYRYLLNVIQQVSSFTLALYMALM
jgi:ABC-type multidrug transport system fused ATPase/permease subunit